MWIGVDLYTAKQSLRGGGWFFSRLLAAQQGRGAASRIVWRVPHMGRKKFEMWKEKKLAGTSLLDVLHAP